MYAGEYKDISLKISNIGDPGSSLYYAARVYRNGSDFYLGNNLGDLSYRTTLPQGSSANTTGRLYCSKAGYYENIPINIDYRSGDRNEFITHKIINLNVKCLRSPVPEIKWLHENSSNNVISSSYIENWYQIRTWVEQNCGIFTWNTGINNTGSLATLSYYDGHSYPLISVTSGYDALLDKTVYSASGSFVYYTYGANDPSSAVGGKLLDEKIVSENVTKMLSAESAIAALESKLSADWVSVSSLCETVDQTIRQ